MTTDNSKYKKILETLRKSEPVMPRSDEMWMDVTKKLIRIKSAKNRFSEFLESLFSWVYVPWVRRSFVAVSFSLVSIFIYQQAVLVKQVKNINRQAIVIRSEIKSSSLPDLGSKLLLYQLTGREFSGSEIKISEKEMEQFFEEFNYMKGKYTDLIRIIESNPELKKYVEEKLNENRKSKPEI